VSLAYGHFAETVSLSRTAERQRIRRSLRSSAAAVTSSREGEAHQFTSAGMVGSAAPQFLRGARAE
jgi:hypothetical protein